MMVHNMMEELATDCLKEFMSRHPEMDQQLDDRNRSDILAIALNSLPPKYVSTAKGEVFTKTQLRVQHESDVFRELSLAIEKVTNRIRKSDF